MAPAPAPGYLPGRFPEQLEERLMEKTNCTQDQAQEALAQGSLLQATLQLEAQGLVQPPALPGHYSTRYCPESPPSTALPPGQEDKPWTWELFFLSLKKELWNNYLELWYKEQKRIAVPLIVPLLLLLLSYGALLLLLPLSLFFGLYYQVSLEESLLFPWNPALKQMAQQCHQTAQNLWKKET